MKKKMIRLILSSVMALSLTQVAPAQDEGPTHGGTLTIMKNADVAHFDPSQTLTSSHEVMSFWLERLTVGDWTLDRETWDFKGWYAPMEYMKGQLAESWEIPDSRTLVFHIRKGVRWQNKPPVNGRELTADDIAYSYHRQMGGGHGFTKGNPLTEKRFSSIESVTATDKYTVVFKAKQPSLKFLMDLIIGVGYEEIVAHEAVKEYGDLEDWRSAVGTGPFILQDYRSGSALTFKKNPDYYHYDERYPKNKLPYVDELKMLIIPDPATALAALRSGKIDEIGFSYTAPLLTSEQAERMAKTNPEIKQVSRPVMGTGIWINNLNKPFDDIRVRKALQMALDLPTIAKTYYGGAVEGIPYPWMHPAMKGFYTPFDQWPEEVRKSYTYNPEGARKLLAEAGYPDGFKTDVVMRSSQDLQLAELTKSYFANIGVDMKIRVLEHSAAAAYLFGGKCEQMCWYFGAFTINPMNQTGFWRRGLFNWNGYELPEFEALGDKYDAILDPKEFKPMTREVGDWVAAHHLWTFLLPQKSSVAYQPWLKGYSGEMHLGSSGSGPIYARLWVDQKLKKSMGH